MKQTLPAHFHNLPGDMGWLKPVSFSVAFIGSLTGLWSSCVFQTDAQAPRAIVFLGNSITQMAELPAFGWKGVYGMAATTQDSDYVHVALRRLAEHGLKIEAVIGDRDCEVCDGPIDGHAENARKLVLNHDPLAVVVQLGENASAIEVEGGQLTDQYRRLLRELTEAGARRIYALSVWDDTSLTAPKTFAVRRAVREFPQVRFLDLTDIPKNPENYGDTSAFTDAAVLWHPGNAGMRRIGERVAEAIEADL